MTVPTLSTLVHEINAYDADIKKENGGGGGGNNNDDATSQLAVPDVHKTSLGPYLKEFHQSFLAPMHSRLKRSRRDLADREAAQNVDF
jgi:hypothetical protein